MPRALHVFVLLLLAGCGSRTGVLSLDPLEDPPDAWVPPIADAGTDAGTDAWVPPPPDPMIEPAIQVSAGLFHTCAATRVGRVHCWGFNNQGQLGDGTSETRITPVASPGVTDAVAITAGRSHSCALRADGTLLCWGANLAGQLGDGSFETRQLLPVPVDGLSEVIDVSAGGEHTCAVVRDGRLFCWGDNDRGQVGPDEAGSYRRPVPVPLGEPVVEVSGGFAHTCARTRSGRVLCWGESALTTRRPVDEIAPPFSPNEIAGVRATSLTSGDYETCAIEDGGEVTCWRFEIASAGMFDSVVPSATYGVPGLGAATQVSAGHEFACAVQAWGGVGCWGNNDRGQLGDEGADTTPGAIVAPLDLPTTDAVSAGWRHACALDGLGVIRCWGRNWEGQLGDGTGGENRPPRVAAVFRE